MPTQRHDHDHPRRTEPSPVGDRLWQETTVAQRGPQRPAVHRPNVRRVIVGSLGALEVRPFRSSDQPMVRRLVLDGLGERWGYVDERLNSDLDDIASTYGSGLTLTAWIGAVLVGTGSLVPRGEGRAEVLRMSTAAPYRGRGIATRVLRDLLDDASRREVRTVVLETAAAWHDARSMYERNGFVLEREEDGEFCRDAFYSLDLGNAS